MLYLTRFTQPKYQQPNSCPAASIIDITTLRGNCAVVANAVLHYEVRCPVQRMPTRTEEIEQEGNVTLQRLATTGYHHAVNVTEHALQYTPLLRNVAGHVGVGDSPMQAVVNAREASLRATSDPIVIQAINAVPITGPPTTPASSRTFPPNSHYGSSLVGLVRAVLGMKPIENENQQRKRPRIAQ